MLGPGNTGPNKTCPQAALCQSDGRDRQVNKYSTVCSVLSRVWSGKEVTVVQGGGQLFVLNLERN